MLIALDTETTGVDIYHGARPFFVTICYEDGRVNWWEWDVNPEDRSVSIPEEDKEHIAAQIAQASRIVMQNCKFDVTALYAAGIIEEWPWEKTEDTLIASHILASNRPHDLTSLAVQYLGRSIESYEDRLEVACKEARATARIKFPYWRLAKSDLPEMPSAKETTWKYDSWLPRTLAKHMKREKDDPRWTVLSEYANADSTVTLAIWKAMEKELERRKLTRIYREMMKLPSIVKDMEHRGIGMSQRMAIRVTEEYQSQSRQAADTCLSIARSRGFPLELPKSGNNKSLKNFLQTGLGLPPIKRSQKTGEPSFDKEVMRKYEEMLEPNSIQLQFIKALSTKRKRDTALSYIEGYNRFRLPTNYPDWFLLHPSLNQTGTDTLRFSSSHPNSQNIEKDPIDGYSLRALFGPLPGREWWSLDAKNIELRIPAYESNEEELIRLYERPDDPPYYGSVHLLNFSTVYPDIWEAELKEVGLEKVGPHCKKKYAPTWYQWVKNGDFAVQYGAIDRDDGTGTADKAFHRPGSHAKLKERFRKLEELNKYWIRYAEKHGYVETLPDKTVDPYRGYPLLVSRTDWGGVLPTVPLNYHVQGTAMWWTRKAMIKVEERLREWRREGFDAWIALQVHDELVIDMPKKNIMGKPKNLARINEIVRIMESCGDDIGIPTPVGCEYHPENWGQGIAITI